MSELGLFLLFQFEETTNLLCHINTNLKPIQKKNKKQKKRDDDSTQANTSFLP